MDNEHFAVHYPQFIIIGTGELLFHKITREDKRYFVFPIKNMGINEKRIRIYGRNGRISVCLLPYSGFVGACERFSELDA
jgi:hypothetical protein